MTLGTDSYTNYVLSVQACNGPLLCSVYSDPIDVFTPIGSKGLKDFKINNFVFIFLIKM